MRLNDAALNDKAFWDSKGYLLPQYDRGAVRENTVSNPVWLHFGAGNIFRSFIAVLQQRLINEGLQDKGIIVAEGYDYEIIDAAYKPFDDLSVSVTLIPDGSVKKTVTGSVVESVKAGQSPENHGGMQRLREIFVSESLQLVSFTITEKGYDITRSGGPVQDAVLDDFKAGPGSPKTFLGKLAALCLHRYRAGAAPLALVSMDNCSKNGVLLHNAVSRFAGRWAENGFADSGFCDYINDPARVSFPCTMIDKITPYPDEGIAKMLAGDGIDDMASIITAKKSVTAPFVNSEEPEYLVIEDVFPNGRPPLEKAGVIFTDRETVGKVEKMKVCTCLNPLHTALSVFACMLGFTRVSEAMKDRDLNALVNMVAKEGLPVVTDPGVISPEEFIDTVINVRLPNPYIPDTPQRIATDTSRKLAARFGETIKAYAADKDKDISTLSAIPLVLAGWLRYLTGIDDDGAGFMLDPDPMQGELCPLLEGVSLGSAADCAGILEPVLTKSEIFGIDLYKAGIAGKVIKYFEMMVAGKGAVRRTLQRVVRS